MNNLRKRFEEIKEFCKQINSATIIFTDNEFSFFKEITIEVRFDTPAFCFNTLISWLYVLLQEASGRNLEFISKKLRVNNIVINSSAENLKKIVLAFRTTLQHNLDLNSSTSDIEKDSLCKYWFYERIQKEKPIEDNEWTVCIEYLLKDTIDYLTAIKSSLSVFDSSENKSIILEEWKQLALRSYTAYDFEKVLIKVLKNFSLATFLDTTQISKKQADSWRRALDILPLNFEFESEAYKIIENYVLVQDLIPVDGRDIKGIGVTQGPLIKKLLLFAKASFKNSSCDKEELIKRIQEELEKNKI